MAEAPAPAASNAAPAARGTSSAKPEAFARAGKPAATPKDPFEAAAQDLRAHRAERLKLVKEDATPDVSSTEETVDDGLLGEGDDGNTESDETHEDEAEPEKVPTWAQKLKDENAKAAKTVEDLKGRDEKWTKAFAEIKHGRAWDAKQITHYKGLVDQMGQFLVSSGLLDQRELDVAERDFQIEQLRHDKGRGAVATKEQQHAQHLQTLKGTFGELAKKFPELDVRKNKDAREFVEMALAKYNNVGNFTWLEAAAKRWVMGWRAEKSEAAKAAPKQKPPVVERRESTTMARTQDGARSAAPKKPGPTKFLSDKDIKKDLERRRASRQQ